MGVEQALEPLRYVQFISPDIVLRKKLRIPNLMMLRLYDNQRSLERRTCELRPN
jgi:hypothetical protein